jgi:hypothetical protein
MTLSMDDLLCLLSWSLSQPTPPGSEITYDGASPLNADLRALPPMLVMRGTLEIFDDAIKVSPFTT